MHMDEKIERHRLIRIAVCAALAITLMILAGWNHAALLQDLGILCFAWVYAFTPHPHKSKTLRDVYDSVSAGWRTPASTKPLTLLGCILVVLGSYLKYQ
ncbi:hypothetical protein GCM10011408_28340 [Dyella caseinilytica]|nr:hypothetical protein GCM10011408_28340 [Dyella caseinilytica]